MKTNKINVVLSLNKTVVSNFQSELNEIIKASGAACGTGKTAQSTVKCGVDIDKSGLECHWRPGTRL